MSNDVTNACRSLRLTAPRKCVLMCLADRADDAGISWPSLAGIAEWTCFSRSTVIEALKALEEAGVVLPLSKVQGRNTTYAIQLKRVAELIANPSASRTTTRPPAVPVGGGDLSVGFRRPADSGVRPAESTRPPAGPVEALNPSASRTGTADAPVRQPDPHPSGSRTGVVREPDGGGPPAGPDTSNTSIDTSNTPEKKARKRVRTASEVREQFAELVDVDLQHLTDWFAVRKGKRAGDLTQTAVQGLVREAAKAGITTAAAVEFCASAEWRGFNAEWYAGRTASNSRSPPAGRNTAGRHSGFEKQQYATEGVNADGSPAD